MTPVMVQRLGEVAADFDAGEQRRPERLDVKVAGKLTSSTADEAPLRGQHPGATSTHVSCGAASRVADEPLGGGLVEPVVGDYGTGWFVQVKAPS